MDTVLWAVGSQASVRSEPALPYVLESCAHKDETAGQAEGRGGSVPPGTLSVPGPGTSAHLGGDLTLSGCCCLCAIPGLGSAYFHQSRSSQAGKGWPGG